MSIIMDYIDFASRTRFEDIPDELVHFAKKSFVDTVAVICYGSLSETINRFLCYTDLHPHQMRASVISKKRKASVTDAALLNGVMAHVDDFDEVSLPAHTAAVAVPAALSAAEYSKASGKELLRAYIIGIELVYRLASVMVDRMWSIGWDITSQLGTIGSAAIASLMLKLDQKSFANALSLATSRAAGFDANFGTMAKPFHIAMAAPNGIDCALLAKCGVTANTSVLEAPKGFIDCFAHGITLPKSLAFGDGWEIMRHGMKIKKYPCCFSSHSAIETLKRMIARHNLRPENVQHICVGIQRSSYDCLQYSMPQNSLEAKFSMSFPLSLVLLNGDLRIADFSDKTVKNPETQEMMKKISIEVPEELQDKYTHENSPCIVRVVLKDDRVIEEAGEIYYFGINCWNNPDSDDVFHDKLLECTKYVMKPVCAEQVYQMLMKIEAEEDLTQLMLLLQ